MINSACGFGRTGRTVDVRVAGRSRAGCVAGIADGPADLPLSGDRVRLHVTVRRFQCEAVLCRQQLFAERFAEDVLAPMVRRTGRLEQALTRDRGRRGLQSRLPGTALASL